METTSCAAALEPNVFGRQGAEELRRFLDGAQVRDETALVITTMGNAADDIRRPIMARSDASIALPDSQSNILGFRLLTGGFGGLHQHRL
jgi:hypothetical protein